MPSSDAYLAKRNHYLSCARKARTQIGELPPRHHTYLATMVTNYVRHARRMNHGAIRQARVEDHMEFMRESRRAR
jgi:hypothetical protein